jgi:hypothetical protein
MRRDFLTAVAVAMILSGGMHVSAVAMALAAPSALGVTTVDAYLIQRVTVVCGNNGCSPVQTKRVQRRKLPQH